MMKNLKVIIAIVLSLATMGIMAYAEGVNLNEANESVIPEVTKETDIEEPAPITRDEIMFHAEIVSNEAISRHFVFELYACDGQTLIERKYVNTEDWETSFNMFFEVSEYPIGEKFILKLVSDNGNVNFNGEEGNEFILETYLTADESGNAICQTSFYGSIIPESEKRLTFKVNNEIADIEYRIFGNEIYISENIIKELKINMVKDENSWYLTSQTEGLSMQFFKNNIYACKNWVGYNLKYHVFEEGGMGFLPLYDIAEYFSCSVTSEEAEGEKVISLGYSEYGIVYEKETFVNNNGVSSKTDYLIWISKKEHTVNVFIGKKGFWHLYKSYPCALGAPNSPTVEGQFEYIEKLDRWSYANYYCGPVMRFYRGYALHSTLIRYNGTPYDDRVGVNISHGCIRLHPADIEELIGIIPFYTKIYITKD